MADGNKMGKCHYCDNPATKRVVWLKNKHGDPARIPLPWCGCDLMAALRRTPGRWGQNPYQVVEGRDYAVESVSDSSVVGLLGWAIAVAVLALVLATTVGLTWVVIRRCFL